MWMIK